jgi:hypothetical protein
MRTQISLDDFDVKRLILGMGALLDFEKLKNQPYFDTAAYERLKASVTRLYNKLCAECPKSANLTKELRQFLPLFDFELVNDGDETIYGQETNKTSNH